MKYLQVFIIFILFFTISCSGHQAVIKDTDGEKADMVKKEVGFSPSSILGSGDEITINVWRHEDLKRTVQIDPSGNIYVPLAGKVEASGLTISQLREKIASGLSKYLVDPHVDINVSSLKSRKVHILGEVKSPGTFILDQKMLFWEAISAAGGFTNDADKKDVLLVRTEKNVTMVTALNLDIKKMIKDGNLNQNLYLRKGDIIYVPPSFIASLEEFMVRLNNILNPFVTSSRAIVLGDEAYDVLRGNAKRSVRTISP